MKAQSKVNQAGVYTKPTMRKALFESIKAGSSGGDSGEWSARKVMSKSKPHYLASGSLYKGETHKVGATLMTGAKHSASSKVLTHTPKKATK